MKNRPEYRQVHRVECHLSLAHDLQSSGTMLTNETVALTPNAMAAMVHIIRLLPLSQASDHLLRGAGFHRFELSGTLRRIYLPIPISNAQSKRCAAPAILRGLHPSTMKAALWRGFFLEPKAQATAS